MEVKMDGRTIKLLKGDITDQMVDAIVNAANPSLMGGGGVDGAIHRRGGYTILEECKRIRISEYPDGLPTGEAVVTTGGNLKANYVIHTVGPIWQGGNKDEARQLKKAYKNSLQLASTKGFKTVAFPSISTGAYGYPVIEAAQIALKTVKRFLISNEKPEEVYFVLFGDKAFETYRRELEKLN